MLLASHIYAHITPIKDLDLLTSETYNPWNKKIMLILDYCKEDVWHYDKTTTVHTAVAL